MRNEKNDYIINGFAIIAYTFREKQFEHPKRNLCEWNKDWII